MRTAIKKIVRFLVRQYTFAIPVNVKYVASDMFVKHLKVKLINNLLLEIVHFR